MNRVSSGDSAANRARWLAELAEALDEARDLVREFGVGDGEELYARIAAVRQQVETMRISRRSGGGQDLDPEWSKDVPWRRSA